jgi:hypothetical protein
VSCYPVFDSKKGVFIAIRYNTSGVDRVAAPYVNRRDAGLFKYLTGRVEGDVLFNVDIIGETNEVRKILSWTDYMPETDVSKTEQEIRDCLGALFVCFHYAGERKQVKYRGDDSGMAREAVKPCRAGTVKRSEGEVEKAECHHSPAGVKCPEPVRDHAFPMTVEGLHAAARQIYRGKGTAVEERCFRVKCGCDAMADFVCLVRDEFQRHWGEFPPEAMAGKRRPALRVERVYGTPVPGLGILEIERSRYVDPGMAVMSWEENVAVIYNSRFNDSKI